MRIAILCKGNGSGALQILKYFIARRLPIDLIVAETGRRKRYSEREIAYQQAHADVHRGFQLQRKRSWWRNPSPLARAAWRRCVRQTATLFSRNGGSLAAFSTRHGIAMVEVKRHSSQATVELLQKHGIQLCLLSATSWLIKDPLLDMPDTPIINVHPGKLPEHRGLDSMAWSIVEGDPTGLTAHFVDEGIDTGPILLFEPVRPVRRDTLVTLIRRMKQQRPRVFFSAASGLVDGTISPRPQNPAEGTLHRPMTIDELLRAESLLKSGRRAESGELRAERQNGVEENHGFVLNHPDLPIDG